MLDPQTYRAGEQLAKSLIPSWRMAQTHNVDHFEKFGFPVRISSIRDLGQIVDTMQENRFDRYMAELGGLGIEEYRQLIEACCDVVRFQLAFLPHRPPVVPLSTIISCLAIYRKMIGINPNFSSVLEIGPGCGYVSFFMRHHKPLTNYSQIEACESFYILQNLVNLHCFGWRFEERAFPEPHVVGADFFMTGRSDFEQSPKVQLPDHQPLCTHYPWWRIGELVSRDVAVDIVTSNANLLEFNPAALNDYLALIHRTLRPEGAFLVQCVGAETDTPLEHLLNRLYESGFAPLFFVRAENPAKLASGHGASELQDMLQNGYLPDVKFSQDSAIYVRQGHPLWEKYYDRKNFGLHFIASEEVVRSAFFKRPVHRKMYDARQVLMDIETALASG